MQKTPIAMVCLLSCCALASCRKRDFNAGPSRASSAGDAGAFPWVRTLDRPVRLYSWARLNNGEAATKFAGDAFIQQLRKVVDLREGPLSRKAEDDFSAMGDGSYLAFSPTESMQFGVPKSETTEGVLRTFVMPAGSRYAVAANKDFVARADALFRASGCVLKPWEQGSKNDHPDIQPADGIRGLRGIQGVFRSCPDVKAKLLDDGNGAQVSFIVYPEVETAGDPTEPWGGLIGLLPRTRIDKHFNTQAVPRWALLTGLPAGKDAEISQSVAIWATRSGFATEGGKPVSGIPHLKSLLHCAVEKGSRIPRLSRAVDWAKRGGATTGSQAAFLGQDDVSAWSKAFDAYMNQPKPGPVGQGRQASLPTAIDSVFSAARNAESDWRSSLSTSSGKVCPTVEALVYSPDPQTASKWKSKLGAALGSRATLEPWGVTGACGFALAPSIAGGIVDAPRLLGPLKGLEDLVTKSNASADDPVCAPLYDAYLSTVVPAYKSALKSCADLLAPLGGQIAPVSIPNSACTDRARDEINNTSFLSTPNVARDLGADELGESYGFTLN